jgi:endonuclease III
LRAKKGEDISNEVSRLLNADQYSFLISSVLSEIHSKMSYNSLTKKEFETYDSIRKIIHEELKDRKINLIGE